MSCLTVARGTGSWSCALYLSDSFLSGLLKVVKAIMDAHGSLTKPVLVKKPTLNIELAIPVRF
jgi:hypothetical protein